MVTVGPVTEQSGGSHEIMYTYKYDRYVYVSLIPCLFGFFYLFNVVFTCLEIRLHTCTL